MLNITPISAFSDNYIWLIDNGRQAVVVDQGDATPVLTYLQQHQLELVKVLVTHHHFDHVNGIAALRQQCPDIVVVAPANSPYKDADISVCEGDKVTVLDHVFSVMTVPGHTLDHICYYSAEQQVLFSGDTLFAGGCGRLFEGTAQQMSDSLAKLSALPANTQVFCAHEYTLANLDFALSVDSQNQALIDRMQHCQLLRHNNLPTVPTTIDIELSTNPFLRCQQTAIIAAADLTDNIQSATTADIFAAIRRLKDQF